MHKKLLFFVFLLVAGHTNGQFVFQASYIAPTGIYAYYFKPSIGFEVVAKVPVSSQLRFDFGLGYYGMKPTKDTFVSYSIESGGASAFIPTKYAVITYDVIPISFGAEYKILKTKLSPFVGLDGNFFVVSSQYYNYIPGLISENGNTTEWELAILPKVGLTYHFGEDWQAYAGISYSLGITGTVDSQQYWKTFISIGYKFDDDDD